VKDGCSMLHSHEKTGHRHKASSDGGGERDSFSFLQHANGLCGTNSGQREVNKGKELVSGAGKSNRRIEVGKDSFVLSGDPGR